jgi:hypothetical protein
VGAQSRADDFTVADEFWRHATPQWRPCALVASQSNRAPVLGGVHLRICLIGYSVWFLRESVRERPELADAVRESPHALLPALAEH